MRTGLHKASLVTGILLLGLALAGFAAWGMLALWFRLPFEAPLRAVAAACWLAVVTLVLVGLFSGRRRAALSLLLVAGVALFGWWSTLLPAHDRDWAHELARTVRGTVEGDTLILRDVRNFVWLSDTDFVPRWETRRYDLAKVASIDLISEYWMGEAIAHTMVSVGFTDGQFLVWSVELRREKHEVFSVLEGFFKQAELITLAGDEQDMVRRLTNVRNEDVRLYRLVAGPATARRTLLEFVNQANDLADHPRWYNTATANCTTIVYQIAKVISPGIPLDWRILASGYFPDYAYDSGALDTTLPFPELRRRATITARARAAEGYSSLAFSKAIRAGLPGIR
jgi:Domain of unknown function (DUF4105)